MKAFLVHVLFPGTLILGLPLFGVMAAGKEWVRFLGFPPRPMEITHAPFSVVAFGLMALFILTVLYPFFKMGPGDSQACPPKPKQPMPWWGYGSFTGLVLFWILAWTRFGWFAPFQAHTFFPLWVFLILSVNGLCFYRSRTCPLMQPGFLLLFPVSALFWWVFEYLNRFVGNWIYTAAEYPPLEYFILATLSFSTVLPAVESVKEYLLTFDWIKTRFKNSRPIKGLSARAGGLFLILSSMPVLFFLGLFPDLLFPFVWISPLGIILGFLVLLKKKHIFWGAASGDYTMVAAYALSALVCGFFWEMFNMYSLARWEYRVPLVQAFHIFEMPLLGYAGYLPFGLECGVIIGLVKENNET